MSHVVLGMHLIWQPQMKGKCQKALDEASATIAGAASWCLSRIHNSVV